MTRPIFTLWPEWRDYDCQLLCFIQPPLVKFLPCDLNEGITTVTGFAATSYFMDFYLVTWMKGLRQKTALRPGRRGRRSIFTLWPEWRDYDPVAIQYPLGEPAHFYLVTWMKGLRRPPSSCSRHCRAYFYLVTWMKGLRRIFIFCKRCMLGLIFTLWPEWRDYDEIDKGHRAPPLAIFTLWPEWRDYD